MFKWLSKKATNNYTEVPLFYVTIDLEKYNREGMDKSCDVYLHPMLDDERIWSALGGVIDYIRENYDMNKISK